jgi:glycosyltransferase involved in cell wall biosynthesis
MMFSIITPSLNQCAWLRLCVASVADQGVEAEHIIQDAGSTDGTKEWLATERCVKAFFEKDSGMYDAINRGLRRSRGEILAYLNCDEQYLPGALGAVGAYFGAHPEVDVLFGFTVLVDATGEFLSLRKTLTPRMWHTQVSHLATLTAATFFRRRIIEAGHFFDPEFRCAGDAEWMVRLLRAGTNMAVVPQITSAFTVTGENLARTDRMRGEMQRLAAAAPWPARWLVWGVKGHHWLRRLLGGVYRLEPFSYCIYRLASPERRVPVRVERPQFRWR